MRIGTQRTVVIVCATRLLRRRIKEILGAPVAERLLNHHGFMASVIVVDQEPPRATQKPCIPRPGAGSMGDV